MQFSNEQMASLAAQVFNFMTSASAPKAVAEKPKRRGNPEALAKARAVKAANAAAAKSSAKPAAKPAKSKAKKFAVGRKIEHGDLVLAVQAPTKRRGRTYVAGFVGGEYVLSIRIDDPKLLARTVKAIEAESISAAMELLAE